MFSKFSGSNIIAFCGGGGGIVNIDILLDMLLGILLCILLFTVLFTVF